MYDRMYGVRGHEGLFGGGAWWHVVIMVFLVAAIAIFVFLVLSKLYGTSQSEKPARHHEDSAIATLRDRFARSEITEDEFRSRLALLEGQSAPTS